MKFNFKEVAIKAGGVSAGAVAGKFVNRFLGTMNPKIRAIGKIAIGAVVPEFMPKQKIVGHIGTGFMAIGAAELFEEFVPSAVSGADDIMSGVGDPMTIDEDFEGDSVNGTDDDDEVSGAEDIMSGADDEDDEVSGADDEDDE